MPWYCPLNMPTLRHRSTVLSSLSFLIVLAARWSHSASAFSTPAASTPADTAERPSRYYPAFCAQLPSLEGRTVVVTGASRGLGLVTARTVASRGGRVLALNRASDRSARALEDIAARATGAAPALVECDLTSFASVRRACREVAALTGDSGGLDVLCCNAGVMLQPDEATADGYDLTAATNVLSHFLLARELCPELRRAAASRGGARVVTMASGSGYGGPPCDPGFLARRGGALGGDAASYERYHQSKLANLAFAAALDRRLRDGTSGVASLACTPGVCGTDMFLHATAVMSGRAAPRDRVPSVEDGALAQLKCIFDPSVESGELWGPAMGGGGDEFGLQSTVVGPPQILVDQKTCDAVWKACEDAVGTFNL